VKNEVRLGFLPCALYRPTYSPGANRSASTRVRGDAVVEMYIVDDLRGKPLRSEHIRGRRWAQT